ncbi:DUF3298 and DUF4163 domain-containing protein [Pedobacter nototheniae]|uniref:DUF3298 and DUF4163 domain-containing protein n=1 Tax=Pedobacter nototheniae TaxID=2488994 RepID=UPI002931EF68|nr:DUF3298 domain-containing protein [Pedobacter nototheniae]
MKHLIYLFLLSLTVLTACNNQKADHKETEKVIDSVKPKTALAETFYKRFEGTVGGKPVVMHLQRLGASFSGAYYYNGSWLGLSTDTLISKDSVRLLESDGYNNADENAKQPTLSLNWTGNGFTGTWKGGKTVKTYPILLEEKYPAGSYAFSYAEYTDSAAAVPGKAKSPVATISYRYLTATGNGETENWINKQIKNMLQLNEKETDWAKNIKNGAKEYLNEYKNDVKELIDGAGGLTATLDYSSDDDLNILYNDKNYTIIEHLNSSYSGGAHGNYGSTMYCLDTKNLKRLKLDDVIKIDSNALQVLLEQNLKKQYNVKNGDKLSTVLFDDYLKPGKNFYFNDNGLAFLYNPYEVASYAQGQIIVFIPFKQLKRYITPSFAERMGFK